MTEIKSRNMNTTVLKSLRLRGEMSYYYSVYVVQQYEQTVTTDDEDDDDDNYEKKLDAFKDQRTENNAKGHLLFTCRFIAYSCISFRIISFRFFFSTTNVLLYASAYIDMGNANLT